MEKTILFFGITMILGLIVMPENVRSSELAPDTTTTIECPSGDKYLCYTTADGRNVRKGKGRTIVTVSP
ncbi:hypothetical protein [Algoriphagus marinus]|uniref:hypothetical protein n=1 Tax=Algoriphagus marinus TaxID=1925762 RepID=UPI0011152B89|nr:hypothetical protein [Algoriphagus marinus]